MTDFRQKRAGAARTASSGYGGRGVSGTAYDSSYYTDGSAARMPEAEESYQERPRRYRTRHRAGASNPSRHISREAVFGFGYTVFLAIAVAVTFLTCFSFINVKSKLADAKETVNLKMTELAQMQEVTAGLEAELDDDIDLNELYTKATQEIGMVYPTESQIIYYESSSNDYVRQYASIPE